MNAVKPNSVSLSLARFSHGSDPWGNEEGRRVFLELLKEIENHPGARVFRISLQSIKRTDASFPRESVVSLAKRYRGMRAFCIVDVSNQDLIDNWDAAALKLDQPLVALIDGKYQVLGPKPSKGTEEILAFALTSTSLTAAEVAKRFRLQINNASNKLKQLVDSGYLLRADRNSESGGIEYVYFAAR